MKTQEIIRQILGVYEALVAYVTNTWDSNATQETARKLITLYRAYDHLVDFVLVNFLLSFFRLNYRENSEYFTLPPLSF